MADNDDWYIQQGRNRLQQIAYARASAVADLEGAKVSYDDDAAGSALQTIADLDAQRANLMGLYQQYWNSQHPPAPPQPSAEERKARTWDRMDWQDIVDMTRTSKYAKDIRPDDPNMVAGYHEAMRRRRAGE